MGFAPDWLALREPADHAARDKTLLDAAAKAAGASPVLLDIGCGTGSTIRAFGGRLPATTQWRLVDNDPALLERAMANAPGRGEGHLIDIANPEALPLDGVTLVTASALLDLVSSSWVEALAAALKARGIPLYAALTYDGVMQWTPEMAEDREIVEAFNRHQQQDKGFGRALGPEAATVSGRLFQDAGFTISEAESAWRLDAGTESLQSEFNSGVARAAEEAGATVAPKWMDSRRSASHSQTAFVGHRDLLAVPR